MKPAEHEPIHWELLDYRKTGRCEALVCRLAGELPKHFKEVYYHSALPQESSLTANFNSMAEILIG